VTSGAFTFIEEGTVNGSSGWVLSTHDPIVIGGASGTALTFSQFSGTGQIIAGDGMNKVGNELNVVGSNTIISSESGVSVNSSAIANQILLSAGTVGASSVFGALPLNDSNAVTGLLPVTNGGTGSTSFTGTRIIASNNDGSSLVSTTLDPSTIVTLTGGQTLTNKIIDSSANTISNIVNANISSIAAIDTTKIADGSVSNLSFQHLSGVTSSVVGISDSQTLTNKTIDSSANTISNIVNANVSSTAAIDATKIANGTVNNASFQQLNGLSSTAVGISDSQTLTNKTIDASANTISNIVNSNVSDIAAIDATKIADGTVSNTSFQKLSGVSSNVVGVSDSQTLTNKTIDASLNDVSNIVNANISATAAIDATKIADGSVSNTSFQFLSGISSDVVGVSDAQTITNKTIESSTLVSPKISTAIKDVNNNNSITLVPVDDAVNSVAVTNAAAGSGPSLSAVGADTNIDLDLNAKGTGHVKVSGLSYPTSDGTNGQVMTTNGSGLIGFSYVPLLKVGTVETTDATPLVISNLTTATTNNTVYLVEAKVVARRSDDGTEGAGFIVRGTYRNNAGTLTEIGTDTMYVGEEGSTWSVIMGVDGTNITITVTGQAAKTIQWGGNVNVTSI